MVMKINGIAYIACLKKAVQILNYGVSTNVHL